MEMRSNLLSGTRSQIGCGKEVMRSTRIRLAAIAALAPLASPRRRKASSSSPWRGCSPSSRAATTESNAAKNDSLEPSQDVFARAGGWIAFRNGSKIVAVDPANPKDTLVLGPSLDDDPIAWSSDGTKLLLRSRLEEEVFASGFVRPSPGRLQDDACAKSRHLLRNSTSDPFPYVTWGAFSPDGTEVAFASDGSSRGRTSSTPTEGSLARSAGARTPFTFRGRRASSAVNRSRRRRHGPRTVRKSRGPTSSKTAPRTATTHVSSPSSTRTAPACGKVAPCPAVSTASSGRPTARGLPSGRARTGSPGQIFVINADGSGLRQVTRDGDNRWPAWSPDGSRIAFVHNGTLSTIAPDGTDMQSVNGVTPDGAIAWNPAG